MPESTLNLSFSEICAEVGDWLGYGRGEDYDDTAWTTKQRRRIESAVKSGLRQFYYPPPIDKSGISHTWSFLKPYSEVSLPSGSAVVKLPDDFGGLDGSIVLVDSTKRPNVLRLVGEGDVREAFASYPDRTGSPEMISLRPKKGTTGTAGQREELWVFPTSDAAYTLGMTYYIHPNALSGSAPFAYGGPAHTETILQACRAAAEGSPDDAIGPQRQLFMQRLAASISQDRVHRREFFGYNGNRTQAVRLREDGDVAVTFGGVQY